MTSLTRPFSRPSPRFEPARSEPARSGGDRLLLTADGVPIMAWHDPQRPGTGTGTAFVIAHGFTVHARRPGVRAVAAGLRTAAGVVSFDFRGHGRSGGASTVGDREVHDLAAAVAWARTLGYSRVVTIGWSMGAGVAVRHAASHGGVDAVIAVSGPSRWHFRGTAPMRLVHLGVETAPGRLVLAVVYGTRIARDGWDPVPEPPDAVVGRIAPVPLLVVHGDADHYFPIEHARWLVAAAGPTAQLWEVPGFGHAEAGVTPQLLGRLADWGVRGSARMPA